jgi:hypothetical protein
MRFNGLYLPKAPWLTGSYHPRSGSPANTTVYSALPGGKLREKANQIHARFVDNATLGGQYFRLDGKPLLVDYTGTPSHFQGAAAPGPWADARYTMRHLTGFVTQQPGLFQTDASGNNIATSGYCPGPLGAFKRP